MVQDINWTTEMFGKSQLEGKYYFKNVEKKYIFQLTLSVPLALIRAKLICKIC